MGLFERFLTVWVAGAILAGVGLGLVAPGVFEEVAGLEVAQVNLVVAVLIWLMIYPMMLKVEPDCLGDVGRRPKGLALTLTINWLVKPFTMAGLAFLFFRFVFADLVPAARGRGVHRGDDPARCGPVHGDGVRVEPTHQRQPELHARPGLDQ